MLFHVAQCRNKTRGINKTDLTPSTNHHRPSGSWDFRNQRLLKSSDAPYQEGIASREWIFGIPMSLYWPWREVSWGGSGLSSTSCFRRSMVWQVLAKDCLRIAMSFSNSSRPFCALSICSITSFISWAESLLECSLFSSGRSALSWLMPLLAGEWVVWSDWEESEAIVSLLQGERCRQAWILRWRRGWKSDWMELRKWWRWSRIGREQVGLWEISGASGLPTQETSTSQGGRSFYGKQSSLTLDHPLWLAAEGRRNLFLHFLVD